MKDQIINLFQELEYKISKVKNSTPRDYVFSNIKDKIKVAIGMRRSGKTYFLLQIVDSLLKNGIPKESILYINFEDDRLLPCNQKKLALLLEEFYSVYPKNHDRKCYLFLDEIQNVDDWALVIRRFHDSKNIEIYLSGSSAKLLSKDLHTSLRGRSIALEMWPFCFTEYLLAINFKIPEYPFSKKNKDQLLEIFNIFLIQGGFPGTIKIDDIDRNIMLQEYVELVIVKDIIERYKISNIILLKYLLQTILKNISSNFSANKFSNDLKSQGIAGSKSSVLEYLEYLEDAYLIFSVKIYSESIRQVQSNPRKMYAVDTGLVCAYTFSKNNNYGHLFENIFYLWLRRKKHKIYYYLTKKDRYEIDFLTKSPTGEMHLYQICWDVENKSTLDRELRALNIAKQELNIEGTLITPNVFIENFLN